MDGCREREAEAKSARETRSGKSAWTGDQRVWEPARRCGGREGGTAREEEVGRGRRMDRRTDRGAGEGERQSSGNGKTTEGEHRERERDGAADGGERRPVPPGPGPPRSPAAPAPGSGRGRWLRTPGRGCLAGLPGSALPRAPLPGQPSAAGPTSRPGAPPAPAPAHVSRPPPLPAPCPLGHGASGARQSRRRTKRGPPPPLLTPPPPARSVLPGPPRRARAPGQAPEPARLTRRALGTGVLGAASPHRRAAAAAPRARRPVNFWPPRPLCRRCRRRRGTFFFPLAARRPLEFFFSLALSSSH